jgi:hypothetical protein
MQWKMQTREVKRPAKVIKTCPRCEAKVWFVFTVDAKTGERSPTHDSKHVCEKCDWIW